MRFGIAQANVFCKSNVKFLATYKNVALEACKTRCKNNVKCGAFLYTKVKTCKLLESVEACRAYAGTSALYGQLVVTSSPSVSPTPIWNNIFSISSDDELSKITNGATKNIVVLLEANIPFGDDSEEKMFILGVKTQQRAAMWVDGEKVLEADASSSFLWNGRLIFDDCPASRKLETLCAVCPR